MHCLCCCVSPLQISWKDATCPPPSAARWIRGEISPLYDSNGAALKESGLIHHSTGSGHHPQSRHQTLISFYSISPPPKLNVADVKRKTLSKTFPDRWMGPASLSVKIACFFTLSGEAPEIRFRKLPGGAFALSLQLLLLAKMSFGLRVVSSNSVCNLVSNAVCNAGKNSAGLRAPLTTAVAHRAKHGRCILISYYLITRS